MTNGPCDHDYESPKRLGRAHYVCSKCGADITLELVFMREAGERDASNEQSVRHSAADDYDYESSYKDD